MSVDELAPLRAEIYVATAIVFNAMHRSITFWSVGMVQSPPTPPPPPPPPPFYLYWLDLGQFDT